MKKSAANENNKEETYNYRDDFQILTLNEKRKILKTAKFLLKLQRDNCSIVAVIAG
jgi:hypothetical protein